MPEFSVKKPLTIFVLALTVLILGIVSYTRMTPDLLPNMDFPYVIVMTAYPGATPEKVEEEVSKPLEQSMSTLEHIKEVSSTSSENVSMVMLEFEDAVNMDTIGVDIQQQIVTLSAGWDDMVQTPYVLKINPSMLPVEVAALSMEGMDTVQLTEFLDSTLMSKLEGIPGVARISTTGMVEQQLHVVLDQKLIDQANDRIAAAINKKLDDTAQELKDQKQELEDSKAELNEALDKLNETDLYANLEQMTQMLDGMEQFAANLPGCVGCRVGGIRFDQIDDSFRLGQIQLAVEEGTLGKFTPLGRQRTGNVQAFQSGRQNSGAAMAVEFHGVFAGVAVRTPGNDDTAGVDGTALLVVDITQHQLPVRNFGKGLFVV